MARADLLLALVTSGAGGDDLSFRRAAEALIAEEEAKNHRALASQLTDALTRRRSTGNISQLGRSDSISSLVHEVIPERRVSELVLPAVAREVLTDLIEEHHRRDLLRSYGVEPRHRVLLSGPPGGGKTTLAEALATELAVPLLTVRYEGLIGSFLGETASRMDALFAGVRTRPAVLFFDEFDSVAKERGDAHETGEIKRVVSSLLLQIDRLPSHVVVVAATNHAELLDRAVWRRMQVRLDLPMPSRAGKTEWLGAWQQRMNFDFGLSIRTIADKLGPVSFAELEEFANDVRRRSILVGIDMEPTKVTDRALIQWSKRAAPEPDARD
ncbi:AAA family ATPase [Okibacterium fritillariae]|uniref:ATPase family associated with various cellular activities (AAA) n=1 Tax=Okibacterium fritillariae TaxID=123320 RepID=A0A1T5KZ92_9MICO|nr:ATP-binding protein [Okibacterium fritillariae]SKC68970.1 ATPase family associated with various cellular activities (AAA) [Okibacterium fritillariae]